MLILGIDPSLTACGLAVVNSDNLQVLYMGCVGTTKLDEIHIRVNSILSKIKEIIKKYKVDAISLENNYLAKDVRALKDLSFVCGAIFAIVGNLNLEMGFYYPTEHQSLMAKTGGFKSVDCKQRSIQNVEAVFEIEIPYALTPNGKVKLARNAPVKNDNISDAISLIYLFIQKELGNRMNDSNLKLIN